jgi:hypothetical protein
MMAQAHDALRTGGGAPDGTDPAAIWRQTTVPVIYRPGRGHLLVKLPYRDDNREWLQQAQRRRPVWNSQYRCWETPAAWLDDVVTRTVRRFSSTWLIQPYREKLQCAPACWNAMGFKCECSCMGANHGGGLPDGNKWHVVSEACACSWQGRELAFRLITVA